MSDLDQDFDWASLESHVTPDGRFAPPIRESAGPHAKRVQHPCTACGGTGRFLGHRMHQTKQHCFACKGKGFFLTSEHERAASRAAARESKARELQKNREAFEAQYPGLAAYLIGAAQWSEFAASLVESMTKYGSLTENQAAAALRMREKAEAGRAKREAERTAGNAEVDLAPIRAMFEAAVASGYKRPIYRAADLVISRAPDHGRNPGALYVTSAETDDYLGKILGTSYTGRAAPGLAAIAADPRGEAVRYGQRTGRCSCCGRELTAEASIEAGIGPICASRWGL